MTLKRRVGPGTRGPWGMQEVLPKSGIQRHVAIFVPFTLLFVTAIVVKAPLERLADPPSRGEDCSLLSSSSG